MATNLNLHTPAFSPAQLRLPRHIAIIMDGNGRWAEARGLPRTRGHAAGAESVREITTECARLGVKELTLYAFSAENWKRPKSEVNFLMRLLERYIERERKTLMENNIRLMVIGRLEELPQRAQDKLAEVIAESSRNTGMVLRLALNYGGRTEILDAVRNIAVEVRDGKQDVNSLNEAAFRRHLYDPEMSDPDLLIRTGGEVRLSNFLLWHISYTELWFTPICWPDFRKEQLMEALEAYSRRERRFGGVPKTRKRRL